MPADDFGIRRGFQLVFRTPELPKPDEVRERAESWRPYRTAASWYLWQVANQARSKA